MIKSSSDRLDGLAGMNIVSTFLSLLALPWVPVPRFEVWPILAISATLHCVYKGSLARVYLHGDLAQAYPIARGLAPLFATLIAYFVLHEQPGQWQIIGIAVISCGLLAMSFDGKGCAPVCVYSPMPL